VFHELIRKASLPILTVTSFAAFANLVVAGCRLVSAESLPDGLKALADIATGARTLDGALGTTGLAAVAAEMARVAEDQARHFTHPGPARDDALALFWQVAPDAFADPATFAAAHLDPALTTDRMVAAIKAGPQARDFSAAPLAEQFFRTVALATLKVMLARAATVTALTPALWGQSLRSDAEILRLLRELHATRETTIPEITLIAMARKIIPRVTDRDEALRALDAAADLAAEAQARGEAGTNVDAFVDATLARLAALTAGGHLDQAAATADAAVEDAAAGLSQLLAAAIRQHRLAFDAEGAARHVIRRITLEAAGPAALFDAMTNEWSVWYERGRDRGPRLDLEVAIALARHRTVLAHEPDQRGAALNSLGIALATLGEREGGTARLEQAVAAYRAALVETTRERVPLDWARTQMNLGTALRMLGERESGTARLEEAVAAYRAALEELIRDRASFDWARAQANLGTALARLGDRENGTGRLVEAVVAFRAALEGMNRDLVPLDWARAHVGLGAALTTLGERTNGTAELEQAVVAFRAALEELIRERAPLDWGMTQANLGTVLAGLGERETGTGRLDEAVAAYRAALGELTRERVPLDWARTQMNLGTALQTLGDRGWGTLRLEQAVAAYRAALEERTRERVPLDWARTKANLAMALATIADRTGQTRTAALSEIDTALEVFRTSGAAPYTAWAEGVRAWIAGQ
jgi:tetratricopeptide (TPR) repeat protein